MMMFLMVLLLMDGDEPPNSARNRLRHQQLRHSSSTNNSNGDGKNSSSSLYDSTTTSKRLMIDDDGNFITTPLSYNVYKSRIQQDMTIQHAIKQNTNSRYYKLITLNEGRDIEDMVRTIVLQKIKNEEVVVETTTTTTGISSIDRKEETSLLEEDGKIKANERKNIVTNFSSSSSSSNSGVGYQNDSTSSPDAVAISHDHDVITTTKASLSSSHQQQHLDEEERLLKEVVKEEQEKISDDNVVYLYPRNATGYYRGIWIRTPMNNTKTIPNNVVHTDNTKKHNNNNNNMELVGNVTHITRALQTWTQHQLHIREEDVGIFFLSPNVYIEPDAEATTISKSKNSTLSSDKDALSQQKQQQQQHRPTVDDTNQHHHPTLTLTKETGRIAFQLYSRSIPAMNELSLIDGLVKLYDGTPTSFVSQRTDILLRVRGVIVHSIGKVSLVTSTWSASDSSDVASLGKRRTILGIRHVQKKKDDDDEKERDENVSSSTFNADTTRQFDKLNIEGEYSSMIEHDENNERRPPPPPSSTNAKVTKIDTYSAIEAAAAHDDVVTREDNKVNDEERRRLLETTINNLLLSNLDSQATMTQIRDEVVDLYSSHYINGDLSNDEYTKNSIKRDGWVRLHTDDDHFDNDEDTDYSNEVKAGISEHIVGSDQSLHDRMHDDEALSSNFDLDDKNASDFESAMTKFTVNIDRIDNSWQRSTFELPDTKELTSSTRYIYPYPYVVDDAEDSIKKSSSHMSRRIPSREQASQANAANCEFEINMDIQETKWTVGEWRATMEHRLRMGGVFNPYWDISQSTMVQMQRSQYLLVMKSQLDFLEKQIPKEALVMTMIGAVESSDCDFHSLFNVTAMRTNWEHTTAKAINYSFYMMIVSLIQIVILLRQLLHTQSQSVASNVSLLCIGWQALLDAILCISHIFLCLVMQPLFTAFASVAFFKLLIFCVIEMKYMAIIIQARHNATGITHDDLRRQITMLHLKFYGALIFSILAFWSFGQTNKSLYILLLYSFWVPQIILNIITESRKPLHPYYLYGMSLTRSVAPVYVFAIQNNFLKEVNPDFPTEPVMCEMLILWIGIQTAILFGQAKYGTRFMIPQR